VKLPQNVGFRKWYSKVHTKDLVNNFPNVGPNENYMHLILFLTLKPIAVYIKSFKLGVLGPHPNPPVLPKLWAKLKNRYENST
jgi:hypothetical protein